MISFDSVLIHWYKVAVVFGPACRVQVTFRSWLTSISTWPYIIKTRIRSTPYTYCQNSHIVWKSYTNGSEYQLAFALNMRTLVFVIRASLLWYMKKTVRASKRWCVYNSCPIFMKIHSNQNYSIDMLETHWLYWTLHC